MMRCCCLLAASLWLVAAAAAQAPQGILHTVDGRTLQGQLTITEDGFATIVDGANSTRLEVAEMVGFERAGAVSSPIAVPDSVWLRSGQRLPVRSLSGKAKTASQPSLLIAELPSGAMLELPIPTLRALRHGGAERPEPGLFAHDFATPPANEDVLYVVKDGKQQRSLVTVTGLENGRIDFLLRSTAYDFDLSGLCAVVFGSNTGFPPDRQPKPRTRVELVTGEVVEGRLLEVGDTIRCRLDEGCVLAVPSSSLLSLQVASDRLVWLGDLKPTVEQTPAFDRVWPWTIDRSVAGAGFVLGGKHYTRGIGLVPRARLTYDLAGRYDVFEATIGIDDRGGPEAHAIFRVLVDGVVVFESQPKTLGAAPDTLHIELKKAKTLAIEVDFGKNYDLGDYCAFAEARVVQQ